MHVANMPDVPPITNGWITSKNLDRPELVAAGAEVCAGATVVGAGLVAFVLDIYLKFRILINNIEVTSHIIKVD